MSIRRHTQYGRRIDEHQFSGLVMRLQSLVVVMLISCLAAGCAGIDVDNAEQALGCTYAEASNYNNSASIDDGSCVYQQPVAPVLGCMYTDALNHNPSATEDDGSCRYPVVDDPIPGCTYSNAYNYDIIATEDDGSCIYDTDGDGIIDDFEESGCTDANANNHNSSSTDDDGSCDYDDDDDGVYDWAEAEGCLDTNATNYDASASDSNQTMCEYPYVMTLGDLQTILSDSESSVGRFLDNLANVTAFIRVVTVLESTDEEGMDSDSNANTTGIEIIIGHDPINEVVYEGIVLRFLGDISMEQTTVQGPDGINYRIGSSSSGSWYYARDEVYQYENPFAEEEEDDEGGAPSEDEEDDEEDPCQTFFESDSPIDWTDNWTLTHDGGINIAEGKNDTQSLHLRLELEGSPPAFRMLEISQIDGMNRCEIEILDPSEFTTVLKDGTRGIAVDSDLPRTSMTMKIENEVQEESDSTKTWSAELSDEHFEEVNLTEIVMRVYAGEEESEEGGGEGAVITDMILSEQASTFTDQCFQWSLSWSDNDNDGYTSAGDAYTVTMTEKVIDSCPDDDEYRNKDFQVVFYDLWADMPTGGVFTPGFGYIAAISALLASSIFAGRRD